mgnify:CR=1 FL=1
MKCNYKYHRVGAKKAAAIWREYNAKRHEERQDKSNWGELLDLIDLVDRLRSELDESPREGQINNERN